MFCSVGFLLHCVFIVFLFFVFHLFAEGGGGRFPDCGKANINIGGGGGGGRRLPDLCKAKMSI